MVGNGDEKKMADGLRGSAWYSRARTRVEGEVGGKMRMKVGAFVADDGSALAL